MTDDPQSEELQRLVEELARRHGYTAIQLLAVRIEPDGSTLIMDKHVGNIYLRFGVVAEWLHEAMSAGKSTEPPDK